MESTTLHLKVPSYLKQRIKQSADEYDISSSKYIIEAITEKLERERKCKCQ